MNPAPVFYFEPSRQVSDGQPVAVVVYGLARFGKTVVGRVFRDGSGRWRPTDGDGERFVRAPYPDGPVFTTRLAAAQHVFERFTGAGS